MIEAFQVGKEQENHMNKDYNTECIDKSQTDIKIQRMLIISILTVVWFVLHTVDCICPLGSSGIHRFGPDCDFMCHCKNNEQCDDTTGECSSGCASFWYGPGCQYRDIAEGEFSRHSDNLDKPNKKFSNLANDGYPETCSFTAEVNSTTKKKNPFWRVWFPTTERISELTILTKVGKLDHFKSFTVYVENVTEDQREDNEFIPRDRQECDTHAGDAPENETINVLCKTQVVGNQVRIQLDVLDSQLVLCNVKIKGGRNLAFGRNISQADAKTTYPASNAVDGRDKQPDSRECSYAGDVDNPWLKLDIGKNTLIWYIRVLAFGHMYTRGVKENLTLQLEDDKKNSVKETIEINGQTRSANISLNTEARYVNITKLGTRTRIQICEIYVFGDCLEDICGLDCSKTCHCKYTSIWDKISGICSSGCKEGWTGESCDQYNATGSQQSCGYCLDPTECDQTTGECRTGCRDGYYPPDCKKVCDDGKYGKDCSLTCSKGCKKSDCDKINRTCKGGCKKGYTGSKCEQMCDEGKDCLSTCSEGCKKNICNKIDGNCTNGCKKGYTGSKCDQMCHIGEYGRNCKHNCSLNCQGGIDKCSRKNGTCVEGCKPGWMGERCKKECDKGNYGKNCNKTCSDNCNDGSCENIHGMCLNGCKPGYEGTKCDQKCDKGKYGKNCNKTCPDNCNDGSCDNVHGMCLNGCKPGYVGSKCDQKCDKGKYDKNCTKTCPDNCSDGSCNNVNGTCLNGCNPGYLGTECDQKCNKGKYGKNCTKTCPDNCNDGSCDNVDGICLNGCKSGYVGTKCEQSCDKGKYGKNCTKTCPDNCNDGSCDNVDGICLNGCKSGYVGTKCEQKCEKGKYGKKCTKTCPDNCKDGLCNNVHGICLNGCKPGYVGTKCDQKCDKGKYGRNCTKTCPDNCNDGLCNNIHGTCLNGCKPGYVGTKCGQKCTDGLYGSSCQEHCSQNCLGGNEKCDHVDGTCSDGCVAGWEGERCDTECTKGQFGENCAQKCSKHCVGGFEMCNSIDGTCLQGCKDGWIERNCDKECDDGFYGANCTMKCGYCKNTTSCDTVSGICMEGCAIGYQGSNCLQALQESAATLGTSTIGIVAGLCFLLLIAVITVAVIFKRRKPQREEEIRKSSGHDQVQNITERSGATGTREAASAHKETPGELIEYANAALRDSSQTSKNTISISSLVEHVNGNSRHILDEFKALPFGMIHPSTIGMKPYNRGKNRYKDMLAYDHSRVILTKCHGEQGSDYINATFIKGYSKEKAYIAAQGPIETSIDDFWRMIWEKNVYTIVMLTNLVEEQKKKCLQYWPLEKSSIKYGDYIVCLVSEAIYAEFIIRNLTVSTEGKPPRNVCQFHFKAWPDKGLPRSPSSLLQFWRKVRRMSKQRPWLVHCSAGVGRTGTFIATDILFDQVKAESYVDVFTCVRDLRDQRTNMVQTKDQYKFLYVLMIECFILPSEPASLDNIQRMITDLKTVDSTSRKTKLLLQYEALNEDMSCLSTFDETEDRYSAARLADNRNKNRFSDIIPQNEFRPFLITNIPNCTNYINAVFMPSYCEINSFILTQIPLENTAIDCCRLVYEQEVNIIVTFEDAVNEKVGIYLPEKDSVTLGPFKVMRNGEEDKEFYKKRTYTMSFESEERAITELVYKAWPKGHIVPKNPLTMLNFIQEVESNKRASGNKPVLVQCLNGAEKSGLIAVLVNILERARLEEEVSIPQIIRQLRVRREQIVPNFEQFQFCYDVLLYYVERETTYANM